MDEDNVLLPFRYVEEDCVFVSSFDDVARVLAV